MENEWQPKLLDHAMVERVQSRRCSFRLKLYSGVRRMIVIVDVPLVGEVGGMIDHQYGIRECSKR